MTTTSESSRVLGVFADRSRADKAIDDLRHAGFGYSQIRLVERGTGGFLDNLKSLFTGQEIISTNTPNDLMKLGVPEQDARYYQSQLDAGRAIVAINATGHLEQALNILHQDGAYDINARLRTAEANLPSAAQQPAPGTPQPATSRPDFYTTNASQGNPNVPPQSPR